MSLALTGRHADFDWPSAEQTQSLAQKTTLAGERRRVGSAVLLSVIYSLKGALGGVCAVLFILKLDEPGRLYLSASVCLSGPSCRGQCAEDAIHQGGCMYVQ